MKTCKICGSQLEDYATFCTNCGSMVENEQPKYEQPAVNDFNYYQQPECVMEENLETVEELSAFDTAVLYAKKVKTAFITSIVSTSLTPFYCFVFIFLRILALIPIVNIIAAIASLIVEPAIVITALVCGIIALVNTSKANKLSPVYEGSVDEETFKAYMAAQKKAKVAKILGIIGTVLAAILAVILAVILVIAIVILIFYVLFLLFGIGGAFFQELSYMF